MNTPDFSHDAKTHWHKENKDLEPEIWQPERNDYCGAFEAGANYAYQKGVEDERASHREFYLAVRNYFKNRGTWTIDQMSDAREIINQHLTAFTAQEQAELPFGD